MGRYSRAYFGRAAACALLFCLLGSRGWAQNATWSVTPATGDFNTGSNWSTGTVPTRTAIFGTSGTTGIGFSSPTILGEVVFSSGAPAYGITLGAGATAVTLNGAGIVNNSTNTPTFTVTDGTRLSFEDAASGGQARFVVNSGGALDISGTTLGTTVGSIEGSGSYVLGSKQLIIGGNNRSTTVGGAISGTGGSLVKIGTGTVELGSVNTYSGPTVIKAGALVPYADSTLGTGNLIFDGGTLKMLSFFPGFTTARTISLNDGGGAFDASNSFFGASGSIIGSGRLAIRGTGTVVLSGSNNYTGGTVIEGGTLQGTTSSLQGNFVNNSILKISQFFNGTFVGSISGSGALIVDPITSQFTVTLSGSNSYSGGTILTNSGNGGALQGTTDSLQGDIANGGTIIFNQSFGGTYAGSISGTGKVTKLGSGTVILTGANTYTGNTTISAGTLQLGGSGTAGGLAGTVFNNANFVVDNGSLSGLVFNGADAALTFQNSGTAGSARIANGVIQFEENSSAGSSIINLGVRDSILFAGSSTAANAGIALGGATLRFQGTASGANAAVHGQGTIDLSGLSSKGTSLGWIDGVTAIVLGDKQLTVGSYPLSAGVNGTISGVGGSLIKVGRDSFAIGRQGVGTYTGGTTVEGGTLIVNGSLASGVMVKPGGTLSGAGTIAGNTVNRGTLDFYSPLTINGTYTQSAGAIYKIAVSSFDQPLRLTVNGTATLSGGTVQVSAVPGNYARETTYTILHATSGVSGSFDSVTSSLAFLTPLLSYDANNVYLSLLQRGNAFASAARTGNQKSVGTVLDQASRSATGDFSNVLDALFALDTTQGPRALDAIGGQAYSGFSTFAVQGAQAFMNAFTQQAGGGQGGGQVALAEACDVACDTTSPARWGAWGGGVGAFGTVAGNANSSGLTYNLGGFAAGLDRRFMPNLVAGVTVGYNAATLYSQGTPGQGNVGTVQFGLYGQYTDGALYLDALGGYARSDNRMTRQIVIPGLALRTAYGQTHADQFFGQLEGGYKIGLLSSFGGFVTPFARLQASTSTQAGFAETGADSLNLAVASQTTQSLRSVLGAQLGAGIDAGWRGKLNLVFRLGWSHEFADLTRPVTASFAGAPAFNFTTQGAVAPRDGVVLGLAANTEVGEATSLYFRYDGDLAGANANHTLSGGVRFVW